MEQVAEIKDNRRARLITVCAVVGFALIQALLAFTIYYDLDGDVHSWINLFAPRDSLSYFGEFKGHGLVAATLLEFAVVPVGIVSGALIFLRRHSEIAWWAFVVATVFTIAWQGWWMWNVVYGY